MIKPQQEDKQAQSAKPLTALHFYRHDPLLVLLKNKCHLSTLTICIGSILLPAVVFSFWWLQWIHDATVWNIGDTLSVLLQIFILFPAIFLIYQLVPASIAELFNAFESNAVIGMPRRYGSNNRTYETFRQQMISWIDNRAWSIIIFLLVLCYVLYRLLLQEPANSSPVPYWMRACAIIGYLPLMYATGISVIRLLLSLIFINWLFAGFTLQIKPLHPDGAGGLGTLSHLLWASISIMLWEALLLLASVLARNLSWLSFSEMILLGAIYITLTPALLIGWLIFPHAMMVKSRDELLQPLTDEYQQALLQSLSINTHDTRSLVSTTRRLTVLKQRYDLLHDSFPTWPMETSTFNRIGATVVLPLILPIVTSLITLALHPLGL
jgi:hypothetical protein